MFCHAENGTAARVAGRDIVVAQDTSELALDGRRARANGYGPVGKGGALGGLPLHAAVALEIGTGALPRLVDASVWNRDKGDRQLAAAFEPESRPILEALSAKLEGRTARQKNPYPKGSLGFAAWVIARLGGWDRYYGKPGPKTMRW
jgi:hypothetical protein